MISCLPGPFLCDPKLLPWFGPFEIGTQNWDEQVLAAFDGSKTLLCVPLTFGSSFSSDMQEASAQGELVLSHYQELSLHVWMALLNGRDSKGYLLQQCCSSMQLVSCEAQLPRQISREVPPKTGAHGSLTSLGTLEAFWTSWLVAFHSCTRYIQSFSIGLAWVW